MEVVGAGAGAGVGVLALERQTGFGRMSRLAPGASRGFGAHSTSVSERDTELDFTCAATTLLVVDTADMDVVVDEDEKEMLETAGGCGETGGGGGGGAIAFGCGCGLCC